MHLKKYLKKFVLYFVMIGVISTGLSLLYSYIPKTLESFDNRLRDYMFILRGEKRDSDNVIIVDLDDKSLKEVGQWPWSRDIVADMLVNLTNAGIGLIAFDIVFAEEDRTNPIKLIKKLNLKTNKDVPDYYYTFAATVANTPTILGYQFMLSKDDFIQKKAPNISAMILEKNRSQNNKNMVIDAFGTILNIPLVQDNAYSSGFFNNVPDESGIVRSVPLIIRYDDQLYPSLALEVVRTIQNKKKVYVNYDENGVSNIQIGDLFIPTDRYGRVIVNFRGGAKTFKYISAADIINNKFNPKDVEGKIAIVGTSAAGLLDLRATPFESIYPGVEVHANVIDNILTQEFISKPSWVDGLNLIHIVILAFLTIMFMAYLPLVAGLVFVVALFGADIYTIFYTLFDQGLILSILFPILTIILSTIASVTLNYFLETRQTKAIKNKFASKVSKDVMESLLANPDDNSFAAMSKEITVFFSDVRGFTNISEAMPNAKVLIEFLNEYMDPMTDIIIKEHGTVDKFIGDAIMAYWNAPLKVENHADKAVKTALFQIAQRDFLNKKINADFGFDVDYGIGINTGDVVVGEIGSKGRSDYTIIGDSVNLASRLEGLCKAYKVRLVVSEFTVAKLKENYVKQLLDIVRVKGKQEPVKIYEIISDGVADEDKLLELQEYSRAHELYVGADFKEAEEIFTNLYTKYKKPLYEIYKERCEHLIENNIIHFDGVFEFTTK